MTLGVYIGYWGIINNLLTKFVGNIHNSFHAQKLAQLLHRQSLFYGNVLIKLRLLLINKKR